MFASGVVPWVVQIPGDADVRAVVGAGDAAEGLFEEVGRGDAFGEGDGLIAQFSFGVDEDGLVGQVLAEEGTVEVSAALEEDAENVAFGEGREDGREAEAAGVVGDMGDFDAEGAEGGGFCRRGRGAAEDEEIVGCGADELRG